MTPTEIAQAMGKKGGCARAASLTPARRSAIARLAARARWGSKPKVARGTGARYDSNQREFPQE